MKKMILLCGFGLLGTFALASNGIVEDEMTVKEIVTNNESGITTGEPVKDADCGCEASPDGTCTITIHTGGNTYTYDPYQNVSYQWCNNLRNSLAEQYFGG